MGISDLILQKWLWIIILALIAICILPFVILYAILSLPPPYSAVAVFLIIVCWGIVAGYKEWILYKKNEENKKKRFNV
jgi:uncharacterized membrane protein